MIHNLVEEKELCLHTEQPYKLKPYKTAKLIYINFSKELFPDEPLKCTWKEFFERILGHFHYFRYLYSKSYILS